MKRLLRWFLRLGLLLVFMVSILFLTSKIVEQKIIEKVVSALNENINVPVYMDEISFSLLKKFPYATLQLKNVTLLSATTFDRQGFALNATDTLLWIDNLYLSLNILSLFHGDVELTKVSLEKGFFNLMVDKKGRTNYSILKELKTNEANNALDFKFLLKHIVLKNLTISYHNLYKETAVTWRFPDYQIKGAFFKQEYDVATKGKLLLSKFQFREQLIRPNSPAELDMSLYFSNQQIVVESSVFKINGQQIIMDGVIALQPQIELNLNLSADHIALAKLNNLVSYQNKSKFDIDGVFLFKALVKGPINETQTPLIQANFALAQGSFKNNWINIHKGISCKGSFSNGSQQTASSSTLSLSDFTIKHKNSNLSGSLSLQNFIEPKIQSQSIFDLNLNDFSVFLKNQEIDKLEGQLKGTLNSNGTLFFNDSLWANTIIQLNPTLQLNISQLYFQKKQLNLLFNNGSLGFENQRLQVNNARGVFLETVFSGSFAAENCLSAFIMPSEFLKISADLDLQQVDYANYEFLFKSDEQQTNEPYALKYIIEASIRAQQFRYQNIEATAVHSQLSYFNKELNFKKLAFSAFDGTADAALTYDFKNEQSSRLFIDGNLGKVDINKLFVAFNNFDQKVLTHENIMGKLTSNFEFESLIAQNKFNTQSIEFLGHVRIDNGRLMNFKPITEVSAFADIKELRNIEFSTLENDLLISKGMVHIPKMEISSNAFDMSIAGQQNFNGDYTYHLQLFLSDFLTGKSKHLQKQQTQFGVVEDDGFGRTRLFLLAESKNGQSAVSLDRQAVKQNVKQGLQEEKRELKKIFQEEFGWFKKDSTLKKATRKKTNPEFQIEWDEE
jgi:hypothetical protein